MRRIFVVLFACLIAAGALAERSDLDRFHSEQGREWKMVRGKDGAIRSLYGKGRKVYSSAGSAATQFLTEHHSLIGVERPSDLRLESVELSDDGADYNYRQYYRGFPVVGGHVSVHVDAGNRIIAANSEYKKGLQGNVAVSDTLHSARKTTELFFSDGKSAADADVMVMDTGGSKARTVWRIDVDSTTLSKGSWQFYVDAQRPNIIYSGHETHADAEGKGNVWAQNPVVTPDRTLERFKNMDGTKKLYGKFVRVYNADSNPSVYDFPVDLSAFSTASDPNRVYDYPENDSRLTEAMAYFHINTAHDNWRSFGFRKLNRKMPVFVNAPDFERKRGLDNAFFSRNTQFKRTGMLVFGAGNFFGNFGLDSDVYYHEYGHAVLDKIKPNLFLAQETNYPDAFHEGFSDIASAAITQNAKLAEFALRSKKSKRFFGRNLDNKNSFPQNVTRPPFRRSQPHYTGLIIGGAWWDLQEEIGAADAQRILFKSLRLMPASELNFFDIRDAMLAADSNVFGGAHRTAIVDAFAVHGIAGDDPGQRGSVTATGLETTLVNFQRGTRKLKSAFKKGDIVQLLLAYQTTSELTPGYNLIPFEVNLSGPNAANIFIFHRSDEARKGSYDGLAGAVQATIHTGNAVPGTYTVSVRSRLGGTNLVTATQSATFTVSE